MKNEGFWRNLFAFSFSFPFVVRCLVLQHLFLSSGSLLPNKAIKIMGFDSMSSRDAVLQHCVETAEEVGNGLSVRFSNPELQEVLCA